MIFANVLLGINQGMCWSTTVIMKIDLVGPRQRGFAMGLNEFAGYLAVALSAWLTSYLAAGYGLRPVPFYSGIAFSGLGLLLSVFAIKETKLHAERESQLRAAPDVLTLSPFARSFCSRAGRIARCLPPARQDW